MHNTYGPASRAIATFAALELLLIRWLRSPKLAELRAILLATLPVDA